MKARQPRPERGASSVEYGLLITGIAAVIVAAVFLLGGGVDSLFSNTCDSINEKVSSGPC